jgi:hypothetical protein
MKHLFITLNDATYVVPVPVTGCTLELLADGLWQACNPRYTTYAQFCEGLTFVNDLYSLQKVEYPDALEAGTQIVAQRNAAPTQASQYLAHDPAQVLLALPTWDDVYNRDVNFNGYRLSSDCRTATSNHAASKCSVKCPLALSKKSFTEGVHAFRVRFDCMRLFSGAGIVDAAEKELSYHKSYSSGFTAFPWLYTTLQFSDEDGVLFCLDMDRRVLTTVAGGKASVFVGLPDEVWLAATMAIPHPGSFTILPA